MTALLFIYSLGHLYKRPRIIEEAVKVENADCCFIAGHWPQRSIFFNPNLGQAVYFLLLWGHLSRILSSPLMTARDCNWVNIVRAFKLRFKFKLILPPSILLGTTVIRIQCRRSMYMNLTVIWIWPGRGKPVHVVRYSLFLVIRLCCFGIGGEVNILW